MTPYRLAILACSASKLDRPAPAAELYQGQLFKLSRQVAEAMADRYVILSAEHRVVRPETVLAPYDVSLETHPNIKWWREQVGSDLTRETRGLLPSDVLCLAPQSYLRKVPVPGGRDWHQPLAGLGIGFQKSKLRHLLSEAQAAGQTLAGLVLQLDTSFGGSPDAPMELDARTWGKLVDQARKEAA